MIAKNSDASYNNCKGFNSCTGIKKAKVFPDPVLAAAKTSIPLSASAIPSFWISVGFVNPASASPEEE